MALQAATLHQLSGGRLILGLGVQARGYVAGWHGQQYRKPVTAMREFVTILRLIFSGERVTASRVMSSRSGTSSSRLEPPARPARIYIAANGPRDDPARGQSWPTGRSGTSTPSTTSAT